MTGVITQNSGHYVTGGGVERVQLEEILASSIEAQAPLLPPFPTAHRPSPTFCESKQPQPVARGSPPPIADTACTPSPQRVAHTPGSMCTWTEEQREQWEGTPSFSHIGFSPRPGGHSQLQKNIQYIPVDLCVSTLATL